MSNPISSRITSPQIKSQQAPKKARFKEKGPKEKFVNLADTVGGS